MEMRNRSGAISSIRAMRNLQFPGFAIRAFWITEANLIVRLHGGSVMSRLIVTDRPCREFAYR